MAVFFGIVGGIGAAALAGGRIAFQTMVLVYGIGTAFSSATRILMGRAAGAGRYGDIATLRRAGRYTLILPGLVLGLVPLLAPGAVAALFTSLGPVASAASRALPLIGICLPLIGWTLANVSVLRALGHTTADMYSNLIASLAVQVPVSWALVEFTGLGVRGAFLAVVAYWLVRGVVVAYLAHAALARELAAHTPATVPAPSPTTV